MKYKKSPDKWRKTIPAPAHWLGAQFSLCFKHNRLVPIHTVCHSRSPTSPCGGRREFAKALRNHFVWRGAVSGRTEPMAASDESAERSERAHVDQLAAYKFINNIIVYSNAAVRDNRRQLARCTENASSRSHTQLKLSYENYLSFV